MAAIDKLITAKTLLQHQIKDNILIISLNFEKKRLFALLNDGIEIRMVYNNYDEYSYSIIYSKLELDRIRFDNYDKIWEVSTKPHHYHPRYEKKAVSSKMTGDPENDIPILCRFLKEF